MVVSKFKDSLDYMRQTVIQKCPQAESSHLQVQDHLVKTTILERAEWGMESPSTNH